MRKEVLDRIRIRMGDITQLEVDAIVNAANPTLLGGEGVDGMIHWAAGSKLLEECRSIGGCPTGEARITGGYDLPARYIIHTVGPVYSLDGENAPSLLASCYRSSLQLAVRHGVATIAFPAISCGIYGYPVEKACSIAIDTTLDFLENDDSINMVTFILFSCRHYDVYMEYFNTIKNRFTGL
ncbi:MAG TPA: O-acetyl-ADP-ribose deacetylase [Geobacteraceae bacterium]|nr:O-acetyl-ADP-ribose deacetylase [Geobacteraceae bacterium]